MMKVLLASLVLLFLSPNFARSETCSDLDAEVLILGGGLAGVSAANRLAELGVNNFVILEAQDRLGGRMRTEELVPGVNVNVGAAWIQGVDPDAPRLHPIFDLAERCGGLEGFYSDFDSTITYDSQGNLVSDAALRYDDYEAALEIAIELARSAEQNGEPDFSVRDALTQGGWNLSSIEDNYLEWFCFDFCFAENPNVSSAFFSLDIPTFTDFLASPENDARDYFVTDNRGFPALIDCLVSNFTVPNDDRIHLEAEVTRIEYSDDCVCATATEDGEETMFCGRYAIVTFSVGVLGQSLSTLFSPPLPQEKQDAFDFIVSSFLSHVFALYDERFWDSGYEFIGHVHPQRGYFANFLILPESRGVNATLLSLTEDISRRVDSLSDDDLKEEITQVFRNIYGNNIPEPNRIVRMLWGTDPFFQGAYSNVRPGGAAMFEELQTPEGRMYFAGEGTNADYSGFMHGAYLSGINTADAIQQRRISSGTKLFSNIVLVFVAAVVRMILV